MRNTAITITNNTDSHSNGQPFTDLNCAEKISQGDTEAFSWLFRKYFEPLYYFAGRIIKDPQASENVVQDVFVKIWTDREKKQIVSNLKSYLYTAVKNHALNYIKREKKLMEPLGDLSYADNNARTPEETLMDKELINKVHQAVRNLPEKCRHIYLMHRYDKLTYNEIAEIQKISVNTVKTQMKRALQKLSKELAHLIQMILYLILGLYN